MRSIDENNAGGAIQKASDDELEKAVISVRERAVPEAKSKQFKGYTLSY